MNRSTSAVHIVLALLLMLSAGQVQAQCESGRQQNRSQQFGMGRSSSMQAAMQQNALQQAALQAAMQQYALQAAYQQNALQTAFQQNAMVLALRQQTQPQIQHSIAQLPIVLRAGSGDSVPKLDSPEDAAARQLKIALELVADAESAHEQGERDRASKMRERAGQRLQKLIESYSGTQAAGEARELLQKTVQQARY